MVENVKPMTDILSLKPRSKPMREKKRKPCVQIPVMVFVLAMIVLSSIASGMAVYTVLQSVALTETRQDLEDARRALNHLLEGKSGKKNIGYTMRHDWKDIVHAAAICGRAHGVRPDLLLAIWHVESRHDAWAVNTSSGATGIGQIIPSNYTELRDAGVIEQPSDLLLNLTRSACASAYFLADYTRRGHGDAWAVAAYGAGPGRAHAGMDYSATVLRALEAR